MRSTIISVPLCLHVALAAITFTKKLLTSPAVTRVVPLQPCCAGRSGWNGGGQSGVQVALLKVRVKHAVVAHARAAARSHDRLDRSESRRRAATAGSTRGSAGASPAAATLAGRSSGATAAARGSAAGTSTRCGSAGRSPARRLQEHQPTCAPPSAAACTSRRCTSRCGAPADDGVPAVPERLPAARPLHLVRPPTALGPRRRCRTLESRRWRRVPPNR